ncbi:MAG: hypothetical protein AAF696_25280, partial [Bacteroidota bacterium]
GISWTELRFKSFFSLIEGVNLYRPNTVDTIFTSTLTGRQRIVYRDSLPGIRSRDFQHFNRHQILGIPLLLGYERRIGAGELAIQSGLEVLVLKQHRGRSLVESGEILDLGNEALYRNNLGLNFLLEGQFSFPILPNKYGFLRIGFNKQLDNWLTKDLDYRARPIGMQINLGISHRL